MCAGVRRCHLRTRAREPGVHCTRDGGLLFLGTSVPSDFCVLCLWDYSKSSTSGQMETDGTWLPGTSPTQQDKIQGSYQLPSLLRDGTDVHRVALYHVQEPNFRDCYGTDHVDPPGEGGKG